MNIQPLGSNATTGFLVPRQSKATESASPPSTSTSATTDSAPATADSAPAEAANVTKLALQPTSDVPPGREVLDKAVKAVNDFVNGVTNDLVFSVDEDSGKTIVKVIDVATKEVIKQYPSEEMLAIAKALDSLKGLLVHQKA
ncbi:flagellar protein FlaG [Propionivibrio sp.]|uniref:flagellar protein FlaG n=1 Tax=Propionivibrio sp. TaxID=2212460 RepID=UPI003BEFB356